MEDTGRENGVGADVDDTDDHGPAEGEVDPKGPLDEALYEESSDGDTTVDPKSVVTEGEVDTSVDGEE